MGCEQRISRGFDAAAAGEGRSSQPQPLSKA